MLNCLVKNISHEVTLDIIRGRLFLFVTKCFGNISLHASSIFPKGNKL